MTGNSLIISREYSVIQIGQYGCSEFVAQKSNLESYTTICLYILSELTHKNHETAIAYMEEWIRFVYEAFECMNIANTPFITFYTLADLKKENPSGMSPNETYIDAEKGELKFNGVTYKMSDETILGITVNTQAIRKHFNLGTNNARKAQLTHTALRYAWSRASDIAGIALALAKVVPTVDKLYLLNVAAYLRYSLDGASGYDYGSLHDNSGKLITKDMFMRRFSDAKISGVQAHFRYEDSLLIKMILEEENLSMSYLLSFSGKSITKKEVMEPTKEYGDHVAEWIEKFLKSKDVEKLKVGFTFVETIFRSTAANVRYYGYRKVGKTIERILFEDEEGTILSIPANSNLIKI